MYSKEMSLKKRIRNGIILLSNAKIPARRVSNLVLQVYIHSTNPNEIDFVRPFSKKVLSYFSGR